MDTIEERKKWNKSTGRDYSKEKEYQSSPERRKYRSELNKYNRKKNTYGNGDGKDASHNGGKIVGFESQSKNRGRKEKSRKKGYNSKKKNENLKLKIEVPKMKLQEVLRIVKVKKKQHIGWPLTEADYKLYHNGFTSASKTAYDFAKKKGYTIDEDDWFSAIAIGFRPNRPLVGKTNSFHVKLQKNGKDVRQMLHFQVYGMENGKYELNMLYIN